ncbi:MAG: M28 family peptidase [Candidatus Aminicenantes bacterium]|nr:MAG: M28 family peptidase [Candidatus Aminicenantes bacterium]
MIKKYLLPSAIIVVLVLVIFSCTSEKLNLESALESITAEDLSKDVAILSSDESEGRAPASKGEEKTIAFLKQEFEKVGLKPGNGESYFQEVPMVVITADPQAKLEIKGKGKVAQFAYGNEFMATTLRVVEKSSLDNSEMVFVGYGIIAPEYNWNDYEGIDVHGKTVVILVNDPGFATKDPELFNGRAMTYYGRWTYKFEEAARQGAEGALIIHETEPAAYPWAVVKNSWSGPQFNLTSEDDNLSRCAVEGWITLETASWLFEIAGLNYDELKLSAAKPGFKGIPMGLKSSLTLNNTIKRTESRNVVALLPGSERADEYIIYMAHWDHFGIDPTLEGDQIFNGALDNATGTAALIELAEAFIKLESPPSRSIVFLAVTGEEQGLLGSGYYAAHPIYPPAKTAAAINMDALNIYGKMKDITVIGYGNSEMDEYVEEAAAEQGRRVRPDPTPERGSFYRSDHFPFAKQGIPALYTSFGIDHVEHGEKWTQAKLEEYLANHYHKPSDEYDPNWDLSGAIEDLRLLFKIGYRLSTESTFPNWKEGTEFKAKRDADMKAVKEKPENHTP